MFLFKKIVAPLFAPVTLILGSLLIGLVLLLFTRKQKTGKAIMTFGVIMLTILSYESFSDLLLIPLERQYHPLMIESTASGSPSSDVIHSVRWIVLLGGGHTADPKVPVTSRISYESLTRLVESIRIHRLIRGSRIILSGGAVYNSPPEARTFSKVAEIFNVNERDMVLDDVSRDTEEQAQNIRPIVGHDRFILVTSAYHMPRAMAVFEKAGLKPIPAPTDYLVKERREKHPKDFYPSSLGLYKAELAMHEHLGLLWLRMRTAI